MIEPEQFYQNEDNPDSGAMKRMWRNIRHGAREKKRAILRIDDARSFIYGIAAAFILYFTSVGIYTTVKQSLDNAIPQELRLDAAYRSAIDDFEKITPQMASNNATTDRDKNYLAVRKEQLTKIDNEIFSLRKEIGSGDISPLTRKQLRQLYSLKLTVLQELVDKGELEL